MRAMEILQNCRVKEVCFRQLYLCCLKTTMPGLPKAILCIKLIIFNNLLLDLLKEEICYTMQLEVDPSNLLSCWLRKEF